MRKQTSISLNRIIFSIVMNFFLGILLLIGGLEIYWIKSYRTNISNDWENRLTTYANRMEASIEAVSSMSYDIYAYDSDFNALSDSMGLDSFVHSYRLGERLQNLCIMEQSSDGFFLFYDNRQLRKYYFNDSISGAGDIEMLKNIIEATMESRTTSINWQFRMVNNHMYGLCIFCEENVALCEVIYLQKYLDAFSNEMKGYNANFLIRQNSNIYGKSNQLELYDKVISESESLLTAGDYYFFSRGINKSNLELLMIIPNTLWTRLNKQQILVMILLVLIFIIAIYSFFKLRKELLFPLKQLTYEMKKIAEGDMERQIHANSKLYEVQQTIATLDTMLMEIKRQKLISYEQTIARQKAQMQYLSLQLKPHFYLNSLKTINALAMRKDTNRIQDIIYKLSDHLRYLLNAEKEVADLKAEIEYVNNYCSLLKDMTDRPIKIEWQIQENMKNWEVPTLCIQTFVENSYKYARLGYASTELFISISINELDTENGEFLDILIEDNGDGYSEEVLDIINGPSSEGSSCVGINNLKRRCELLYGDKMEYSFYNDNGAASELIIPMIKAGD